MFYRQGSGWCKGNVKCALTNAQQRKTESNYEVKYEDGDRANNLLLASLYAGGDSAPYGSWVLLKRTAIVPDPITDVSGRQNKEVAAVASAVAGTSFGATGQPIADTSFAAARRLIIGTSSAAAGRTITGTSSSSGSSGQLVEAERVQDDVFGKGTVQSRFVVPTELRVGNVPRVVLRPTFLLSL